MDLNHMAHRPASYVRLVNTAQITLDPKPDPLVWCGSIQCAHLDFAQKMRVPTVRLRGFLPVKPHATKFDVFVAQSAIVGSRQIALPNAVGIRVVCAHATINTTARWATARTSTAHRCASPKGGAGVGCNLTFGIGVNTTQAMCDCIMHQGTAPHSHAQSIQKNPRQNGVGEKGSELPTAVNGLNKEG